MSDHQYDHELEKLLGIEPPIARHFELIEDEWILTPADIADFIGMSAVSVRRWCRDGRLPSYRFNRKYVVTGKEFKRFMKQSKMRSKELQSVLKR